MPADAFATRTLDVRLAHATADAARVVLPHRRLTSNRNGTLHGGVTAALGAVAGTTLARVGLDADAPPGHSVDLVVAYLAPTNAASIVADARCLRRGRDLVHADVAIADDEGRAVAQVMMVHRVAAAPAGAPMPAPSLPAVTFDPARGGVSGSPFTAHLGVTIERVGPGRSAVLLPWREELTDAWGSLHEGAVAALVDSAGGVASWAVDGFDPRGRAWTVGMHLHFHGPERREDLVAHGATVGRHGGLHFNTLTVVGRTSGRVVASGTITFQILRPDDAPRIP